jgi:hypothetical protein
MIFPPDPLYPLGPFQIFPKIRGDICKSRCTTGMNDTGDKFADSINNNFPPVSTTQILPPFLLVLVIPVTIATGVNDDTGSK